MSFCPSKDIHSVYLDNELPEHFKAEYELHLKNCPACQKELERIRSLHMMFDSDSKSSTPDKQYLDQSFERLQIKMAYSKNTEKAGKSVISTFKYIPVTAAAAAAVFAVFLFGHVNTVSDTAGAQISTGVSSVNTVASMITANNSLVSANNVSFDSGKSVLVSGNIHETVLSSEAKRKENSTFTKNVKEIEVLRPDLEDEAISIRVTVPGMGSIPVTTEINVPMGVISGRF